MADLGLWLAVTCDAGAASRCQGPSTPVRDTVEFINTRLEVWDGDGAVAFKLYLATVEGASQRQRDRGSVP